MAGSSKVKKHSSILGNSFTVISYLVLSKYVQEILAKCEVEGNVVTLIFFFRAENCLAKKVDIFWSQCIGTSCDMHSLRHSEVQKGLDFLFPLLLAVEPSVL